MTTLAEPGKNSSAAITTKERSLDFARTATNRHRL
jgi:hypothetical protein